MRGSSKLFSSILCFSMAACTAPGTQERTVRQGNEKVERSCTEKPPEYTNQVEARLRAAIPLETKTEAQAEGVVRQYLDQHPKGTNRGEDLKSYLFYICQMSNNGSWSSEVTERLINLFLSKWPAQVSDASVPPHSKCAERLRLGYALKERVDSEYWAKVKAGIFQAQRDELTAEWDKEAGKWAMETESVLLKIGGPIAKGRFQNATIPASFVDNTNMKWNGVRNFLQGRLLALELACGQVVGATVVERREGSNVVNLQRQAFNLAQDLRKFQLERDRSWSRLNEFHDSHPARSEEEKNQRFHSMTKDLLDLQSQQTIEFGPLRVRAIILRDEILGELPLTGKKHMLDWAADMTLEAGALDGPHPASDLADYIELLARLLGASSS